MLGGTFIREHNLIFDIENNQVGVVHAVCHVDPNQITSLQQMSSRKTWVEDDLECDHEDLYNTDLLS